jgi:CRP/FNR family cyclic AMP-dependent transcriptional regulator
VFHFTAAFGVPMPDLRARALTDAVVLAAPGSLVLETLRNHPPALARALAGLAAQTVAVERLLARTAHQGGLRRRIVLLLASLELAAADDRGYRRLVDPPTHAQIAARVGARRETVTRLIARLEAEGVVRRERRGLMLLPTRLRPEA